MIALLCNHNECGERELTKPLLRETDILRHTHLNFNINHHFMMTDCLEVIFTSVCLFCEGVSRRRGRKGKREGGREGGREREDRDACV